MDVVDAEKGQPYKGIGSFKMLVRRWLSILLETLEVYNVRWNVFLAFTNKNKADGLIGVAKIFDWGGPNHKSLAMTPSKTSKEEFRVWQRYRRMEDQKPWPGVGTKTRNSFNERG